MHEYFRDDFISPSKIMSNVAVMYCYPCPVGNVDRSELRGYLVGVDSEVFAAVYSYNAFAEKSNSTSRSVLRVHREIFISNDTNSEVSKAE